MSIKMRKSFLEVFTFYSRSKDMAGVIKANQCIYLLLLYPNHFKRVLIHFLILVIFNFNFIIFIISSVNNYNFNFTIIIISMEMEQFAEFHQLVAG